MRIGYGYDSHVFIEGDHVPIGGVKIPFHHGVKAHSDGDVLLHAIGDAMLGAAGLGDLGKHFPDTDESIANISSLILLKQIRIKLEEKNFFVINVDSTVITEAPKLGKYIDEMNDNIADVLLIPTASVNVKATTNEKMGWIGRGNGLAAHAVVLIQSKK